MAETKQVVKVARSVTGRTTVTVTLKRGDITSSFTVNATSMRTLAAAVREAQNRAERNLNEIERAL